MENSRQRLTMRQNVKRPEFSKRSRLFHAADCSARIERRKPKKCHGPAARRAGPWPVAEDLSATVMTWYDFYESLCCEFLHRTRHQHRLARGLIDQYEADHANRNRLRACQRTQSVQIDEVRVVRGHTGRCWGR